VHAFVGAVFLGTSWVNALMLYPQSHPPDVELRESVDGTGGERDAVVRTDGQWKSEVAECALEDGSSALAPGVWESFAGQQVSGMLVADGQGEAPYTVLGMELAFEVGGPEVIWGGCAERHDTGMQVFSPSSLFFDQALPGEEISHSADGGPGVQGNVGVSGCEPVEQFLGSPIRVLPPSCADQFSQFW